MNLPKFSIITPSFNQGEYIRDTIHSVLAQDYPHFEHIVIDGGSTDNTVSILKEYPHLHWTSEKDRGQSDALNKGFSRATGDIIGWINSDDYFAPGIFHEVANALERYPIVLGACQVVDEKGNPKELVPNVPRTWLQMLKYWVPYSIPAQPSIFFRKELLEKVRRHDGTIFDTELYYCMDYDLWMRLCRHMPLTNHIQRVLSYYRMTPTNKTGGETEGMPYAEPEMSRIFRRYKDSERGIERALSIIGVVTSEKETTDYINAYRTIHMMDSELLLILPDEAESLLRPLRKIIGVENERMRAEGRDLTIRIITTPQDSYLLHAGNAASGSTLIYTVHAQLLRLDWCEQIVKQLQTNKNGAVCVIQDPNQWGALVQQLPQPTMRELFQSCCNTNICGIRKVALEEYTQEHENSLIQIVQHALEKGWQLGGFVV